MFLEILSAQAQEIWAVTAEDSSFTQHGAEILPHI